MMVALSGSVALVVTVDYHKTMAKGGAHTSPDQTPNHTMLHMSVCSVYSPIVYTGQKHQQQQQMYTKKREGPTPDQTRPPTTQCYTHLCILCSNGFYTNG